MKINRLIEILSKIEDKEREIVVKVFEPCSGYSYVEPVIDDGYNIKNTVVIYY